MAAASGGDDGGGQGEAETQPLATGTNSLFGDPGAPTTSAETPTNLHVGDTVADTSIEEPEAARPGNTTSGSRGPPLFWNLRGHMAELDVPSSAERNPDPGEPTADDIAKAYEWQQPVEAEEEFSPGEPS